MGSCGLRRRRRVRAAMLAWVVAWSCSWLPAAAQGGPLLTINQIRAEGLPEVAAYITVSDPSGIPIPGLAEANFEVFEDGEPMPAFTVSAVDQSQESIAAILAIDTSGSMKGQPLEDAKAAAKSFIEDLAAGDQAAVLSFGPKVELLQDFSRDKTSLKAGVEALTAEGDTALYDAIYDAVGHASRLPPGRKMVLILTDGEDTESSVTLDDAITRARDLNVPVFAVGLGRVVADPLKRLAKLTGGRYFEALSSSELTERFRLISDQLRHQYVVSYRSMTPPDGKEHTLVVKTTYQGEIGQDTRTFVAPSIKPAVGLPGYADGTEVSGVVEITPDIQPPDFVAQVQYFVDGELVATVDQAPFSHQWDTRQEALGERALTVVVEDRAGNKAQETVRLEVVPLLEVEIVSPIEGALVSGIAYLEPAITAFYPLAAVEYLLDGQPLATVAQAPFAYEWDLAGWPSGDHTVVLRVRDTAGNTAEAARTLRVRAPLSVSITHPVDGKVVKGKVRLTVALSPDGKAERVEYLLDGEPLVTVTLDPFAYDLDTAKVPPGEHTLTARASGRGESAEFQVQVVVEGAGLPLGLIVGLVVLAVAAVPFVLMMRRQSAGAAPAEGLTREMVIEPEAAMAAGAWLEDGEGHRWGLRPEGTQIGRQVVPGDIHIDDPLASRQHGEVRLEAGAYVYYDLGATNPALINGEECAGSRVLREGDVLTVGDTSLVFRLT